MAGGKTKNSALTTALSFHYQLLVGLDKCFSLEEGQSIWFEKDGDVSQLSPDASTSSQTEVKNYDAPLTDHHENLWKTLKNWLAPEFDHTQYSVLVLHTTQSFGEKTRLKDWNAQSAGQRLDILKAIFGERSAKELNSDKPSEIIRLQKAVMGHDELSLKNIVGKIVLFIEAENAEEIARRILKMIHGIPSNNLHKYFECLIGFIYQQATPQSWSISHSAFSAQCEEITALLCRKEFTFPPFHGEEASEKQVEQHQEKLFVQKIYEIDHHEMIPEAVGNWLELQNSLMEELHESVLYKNKTIEYQKKLVSNYKKAYSTARLEGADEIQSSKRLYNLITREQALNMGNDIPPIEYKNGLIHDAMDDEERNLRWKVVS